MAWDVHASSGLLTVEEQRKAHYLDHGGEGESGKLLEDLASVQF